MKKIFMLIIVFFLLILSACNSENEKSKGWEESPTFISNNYQMVGNEGRSGFIYDKKQIPMIKDQPNKYMWHFWGDKEKLTGKIKILGTHEGDHEPSEFIAGGQVRTLSPINGADHSLISSMSFPKSGMWKLDVYIDDELFDTIYVHVKE